MPLSTSHGKVRAENFRTDELPKVDPAALTAAERDPKTGRFTPGNAVSRRRKLIAHARALPWLDEARCEPWMASYVRAGKAHAVDIMASLPPGNALLSPLAEELASARIVYRALLARGLEGDQAALDAAKGWLRESRQHALALEGMARKVGAEEGNTLNLSAVIEASKPRSNGGSK